MTYDSHTRPNLQDRVREHYADHALPSASLDRLLALQAGPPARVPRAQRWVLLGALAATLALAVLGVAWGVGEIGRQPTSTAAAMVGPKLVAVQIHADWCARSPEVAPVFADLLTQFGNEPVLFVTFDITDDTRREQARLLSTTLGIPQAFDEPFQSGMIKLIDRESHTLLAAITGREEAGELEVRIAELLEQADRAGAGAGGGA